MKDLIIIGAGPAGLYASTLAAMQGLKSVILESSLEVGGQLTLFAGKPVYDFPAYNEIIAGDIITKLLEQQKNYLDMIELKLNHQVLNIETHSDFVTVHTNQGSFEAKYLLIASGSGLFSPRKLGIEGTDEMKNVFYVVDDLKTVEGKDIAVLGGGDSAVDWAIEFAKYAKSVSLIHRRHQFRAHEANVDKAKAHTNVLTAYAPIGYQGTNEITHLVLKNMETKAETVLKTDMVFVFYGTMPSKNVFESWNLNHTSQGLIVSSDMQTSNPLIFACGNVAAYPGKVHMIITALGEAATAISSITHLVYPNKKSGYLV